MAAKKKVEVVRLQTVFGSRAYCFAEANEGLEAFSSPVHLVIDGYVELRDEDDNFVEMHAGKSGRFDLSIAEARITIEQLQAAILVAEERISEVAYRASLL